MVGTAAGTRFSSFQAHFEPSIPPASYRALLQLTSALPLSLHPWLSLSNPAKIVETPTVSDVTPGVNASRTSRISAREIPKLLSPDHRTDTFVANPRGKKVIKRTERPPGWDQVVQLWLGAISHPK